MRYASIKTSKASPRSNSDRTKTFTRDWERRSHSARFELRRLKAAMLLLIANECGLPAEYDDYLPRGERADYRECHIGGDFIHVYQRRGNDQVIFVRAGTHADIFKE